MSRPTCIACGTVLPPAGTRGPARVYCSGRCRESARRRRNAALRASTDAGTVVPLPAGRRSHAHPDDDLAATVLLLHSAAGRMQRHALEESPQLAWHCEVVAQGVRALLIEHFGDV